MHLVGHGGVVPLDPGTRGAAGRPRRGDRGPQGHGRAAAGAVRHRRHPRAGGGAARRGRDRAGGRAAGHRRRTSSSTSTWSAARCSAAGAAWARCAGCTSIPANDVLELDSGEMIPFVDRRGGCGRRGRPQAPGASRASCDARDRRLHPVPGGTSPGCRETRPLRNATEAGRLRLRVLDLRDHALGGYRQVDDAPYGGGAGMLIRVDVVCAALESTYGAAIDQVLRDAPGGGAGSGRARLHRRRGGRAGRRRSG